MRDLRVPIVPAAILFDLANGGDKDWGRYPPYRELGYDAAAAAVASMDTGRRGAGYGATTATTPGGIGLAAERLACGATVMAIMAVNAAGSPLIDDTGHFWAAPFERNGEFGGRGWPTPMPARPDRVHTKAGHDTADAGGPHHLHDQLAGGSVDPRQRRALEHCWCAWEQLGASDYSRPLWRRRPTTRLGG